MANGLKNSSMKALLEHLGYLKVKTEELEAELKAVQGEILSRKGAPEKADVPYGTLSLRKRDTWKITGIPEIFKIVGRDTFLSVCTVPMGKLKKAIGELGIEKLKDRKLVEQGDPVRYYSLKRAAVVKANRSGSWPGLSMPGK